MDRIVIEDHAADGDAPQFDRARITDSVEQALSLGVGVLELAIADADRDEPHWKTQTHSQHLVCGTCGRSFTDLTPHHFSFNTAIGWCGQCEGLGTQTGTNPNALITSPTSSLAEGAALLWPHVDHAVSGWMLRALSRHTGIPVDVPYEQLTVTQRRVLFRGTGPAWIEVRESDTKEDSDSSTVLFRFQFKGFYPALDEASRLTPGLRGKLDQFTAEIDCTACDGSRLREEAAAVRFRGHTIADLVHMPLDRLAAEVKTWTLDRRERKIAGELIREIKSRVRFLIDVGLDYLTLHRGAATLSGGEAAFPANQSNEQVKQHNHEYPIDRKALRSDGCTDRDPPTGTSGRPARDVVEPAGGLHARHRTPTRWRRVRPDCPRDPRGQGGVHHFAGQTEPAPPLADGAARPALRHRPLSLRSR